MTLAKKVIARAASAKMDVFATLEGTLGVACLGVSPGSSSLHMMDYGRNDKRYRLTEGRENPDSHLAKVSLR